MMIISGVLITISGLIPTLKKPHQRLINLNSLLSFYIFLAAVQELSRNSCSESGDNCREQY